MLSAQNRLRAGKFRNRVAVLAGGAAVFGGVVAAGVVSVGAASASAVVNVPCAVGGPDGLIAAIDAANKAGGGTLELAKGCTYTLTAPDNPTDGGNGLPVLTGEIAIDGSGGTTIARSTAPGTPHFRIIEVGAHATNVSITNLTITGGLLSEVSASGGGIANDGLIGSLSNDSLVDDSAPVGGGLYNNNLIGQVNNVRISDNTALNGGGIFNLGRIRSFTHDVVSANKAAIGAGISSSGAIDKLANSTISKNHLVASDLAGNGAGGGIANVFGVIMMTDDTVSNNTATNGPQASGGGIDNSGRLIITGSLITHNVATSLGGGIRNDEQAQPHLVLTVKSSKITDNAVTSAHGVAAGGGIYNDGAVEVTGTEVRGNKANEGGGLFIGGESRKTALERSTITENHAEGAHARGGGIFFAGGAPVTLLITTVKGNRPQNCFPPGKVAGCSVFL